MQFSWPSSHVEYPKWAYSLNHSPEGVLKASKLLHLVLLECPLELIPPELTRLKEIQRFASLKGKKPQEVLLDQSHHGRSMTRLQDSDRRGRPDIVFLSLMSILESPLCKEGLLTIHLHLRDNRIVEVKPDVRLPRNYDRFVGLMEQLLGLGSVPPEGPALLRVIGQGLSELLSQLPEGRGDALTVLAVEDGRKTTIDALVSLFPEDPNVPVIVGVGAFPHGDFDKAIPQLFENHVSLYGEIMMAWHVCSEMLWTYSLRTGISRKQFSSK